MAANAERRKARAEVESYYQAQLTELVDGVADEIDRYRAGEVNVGAVDDVLRHYERSARELWTFCWRGGLGASVERVAAHLHGLAVDGETVDWWQQGADGSE